MSELNLKRGTLVIWSQREANTGSAKMVLGIVQGPVDSEHVTIEVVDLDVMERLLVTVPAEHVRNF